MFWGSIPNSFTLVYKGQRERGRMLGGWEQQMGAGAGTWPHRDRPAGKKQIAPQDPGPDTEGQRTVPRQTRATAQDSGSTPESPQGWHGPELLCSWGTQVSRARCPRASVGCPWGENTEGPGSVGCGRKWSREPDVLPALGQPKGAQSLEGKSTEKQGLPDSPRP